MHEDVFRALADGTRRQLLDALFEQDGQTLGQLEARFEMTRFGVMKHLTVLEAAGLVVTQKRGREKAHFLNTVPLREVYERWVTKYTGDWAAGLLGLKKELEMTDDRTQVKVYEIYIKTTPEKLWHAITDPELRGRYTFGAVVESDFTPGSTYTQKTPDGFVLGEGDNLVVEPPHRLVQTMRALWSDDVKAEGTTRVTWEIEQVEDSCRLVVTHDQMRVGANEQVYGGWPMILSGLKTLLETGELLTTPGSLMYARG